MIAAGDILNFIDIPGDSNEAEVSTASLRGKRQWWTLWLKRKRRTETVYDFGDVANPDVLPIMTAAGDISLEAGGKFLNQGG